MSKLISVFFLWTNFHRYGYYIFPLTNAAIWVYLNICVHFFSVHRIKNIVKLLLKTTTLIANLMWLQIRSGRSRGAKKKNTYLVQEKSWPELGVLVLEGVVLGSFTVIFSPITSINISVLINKMSYFFYNQHHFLPTERNSCFFFP